MAPDGLSELQNVVPDGVGRAGSVVCARRRGDLAEHLRMELGGLKPVDEEVPDAS